MLIIRPTSIISIVINVITPYHRYKRWVKLVQAKKFDCSILHDHDVRAQYQQEIRRLRSEQLAVPTTNESRWDALKACINESAKKTVGYKQNRVNGRLHSAEVQ